MGAIALGCTFLLACGAGQSTPLARIAVASPEQACAASLAPAIAEARAASGEDLVPALVGAIRWAGANDELECNPVVTARQLWQEALRALRRIGGLETRLAMVASLGESHRPGSVHDRHNAASRNETVLALRLLAEQGPLEPEVALALLDWYGAAAADCSAEAYRRQAVDLVAASDGEAVLSLARSFPPPASQGRCAAGWLLGEVHAASRPELQAAIVEAVASSPATPDDAAIAHALATTSGRLLEAVQRIACAAAVRRAREALEQDEGDPTPAVSRAGSACPREQTTAGEVRGLGRALTQWLVERGRAEEAWQALVDWPDEEVDETWRAEVGVPLVLVRIQRGALVEAVLAFEELTVHLGPSHTDLQPIRETVRQTLFRAVAESLEAGALEDVRVLLGRAERLFGSSPEGERFELMARFAEAAAIAADPRCRDRGEIRRIHGRLEVGREQAAGRYAGDLEVRELVETSWSRWRAMLRRCS